MSFPRCFFNILYHLSGSNIQLCAVCAFFFFFALDSFHDIRQTLYWNDVSTWSRLNTVSKGKKGKGNNRACKQMVLFFFFNSKEGG